MSPENMIGKVDDLLGRINQLVSSIRAESEDIAERWQALGMQGAQRADHAALLLGRMRPALVELSRFAANVDTQITGMIADPFERTKSA